MMGFGPDVGGLDCEPEIIYEMLQARNSDYTRNQASRSDLLGGVALTESGDVPSCMKSIFLSYAFFGLVLFVASLFFTTEDIKSNSKPPTQITTN